MIGWTVNHDDVNWKFLQSVYGWSGLQYSTWLRGDLVNLRSEPQLVSIHLAGVLELRINNHSYFGGDFYGTHKAPLVLELPVGKSIIDVRLTRDVRAMGGTSNPSINADLTMRAETRQVRFMKDTLVIPEMYNGLLSSIHFGVTLQNSLASSISVTSCNSSIESGDLELVDNGGVKLTSGQARPLTLRMKSVARLDSTSRMTAELRLCYTESALNASVVHNLTLTFHLTAAGANGLHRFTFLHPSGVVSYALIRPPDVVARYDDRTPVLLALHGAGVDVDGEMMRHSLDGVKNLPALTVFPTGMNTWSADDWHTWAMADVFAAVEALSVWQTNVAWSGPPIDTERLLVTGHSNGGQGTWYLASHRPDRIMAAAPLSGYTSIENYVPYSWWHVAEQNRILDVARLDFRNELFVSNLRGIPVLQQHGAEDNNVPIYHSRLMRTYQVNLGFDPIYVEVPGHGHWWDGVLTTDDLQKFYRSQFTRYRGARPVPSRFEYVVADSANFGSMYGLHVDQLYSHDQLGHLEVTVGKQETDVWHIATVNVHRFHVDTRNSPAQTPRCLYIDYGNECLLVANVTLARARNGTWTQAASAWPNLATRYGRQRGALDAIMNTFGPLTVFACAEVNRQLALQISRNMLQYFGADCEILEDQEYRPELVRGGNVVVLIRGSQVPPSLLSSFPITVQNDVLRLEAKDGFTRKIEAAAGMGAAFLRPLPGERLELVIWGYDDDGLSRAARLIPTITGAGQPDFVILRADSGWKGSGGAVALGFFDHDWQISRSSQL